MFARSTSKALVLAPSVALTLLLAACSSGGEAAPATTTASPSGTAANATVPSAEAEPDSYPLPDCTGLDAAACSTQGFDPDRDGFGFANWGGEGSLNATSLVTLFGERAVCAKVVNGKCTLYPAAKKWAAQINEAMAGGHCEGMAVLSQLIFQGYLTPGDLDPAAGTTFALSQDDPDVYRNIDLLWATQMLPSVQEAYNAFKDFAPTEIAAELAAGLQSGTGYTLGLYSPNGAHAVTPIAVTREGDRIAISIYDNNYPGTVQRVMIDPVNEIWSYAGGATNPDAPTDGWEGGLGTMDLTPMEVRLDLPSLAPFAEGSAKGATRGTTPMTLMVTSPDPEARVGFELTYDGQTYDTTDPTTVYPAGIYVRPTLGTTLAGKGTTLIVDRAIATGVGTRVKQASGTPGRVTVSADAVGSPRLTLDAGMDAADAPGFDLVDDGVVLASGGSLLNVANGLNSLDLPIEGGLDVAITQEGGGVAGVFYLDGDRVVGEYALDDETESGDVVDGVAEFDAETGEFTITEELAEPEAIDDEQVSSFGDQFSDFAVSDDEGTDEEVVDSSDDGTSDDSSADDPGNEDTGSDDAGADDSGADESQADESDSGADEGAGSGADSGGDDGSEEEPVDDSGADATTDEGQDVATDEGGDEFVE